MRRLLSLLLILLLSVSCGNRNRQVSSSNETVQSEDYNWLAGDWKCNMGGYGSVCLRFNPYAEDGSWGDCTEISYGSYKNGSYSISDNVIRYKLNGESWSTTIQIESGHRLNAGEGYYYHKF